MEPDVNVDEFIHRPAHQIVAVLGGEADLTAVVGELRLIGVPVERIRILCGIRGAEILDKDGRHHGLPARVIRGIQRLGYDQSTLAIRCVTSVASFFVSRVDTEIDARLDKLGTPAAAAMRGKAAIANARLAYSIFEDLQLSKRWRVLSEAGARPQRPLWASTSAKDPAYSDTKYVSNLVAPNVVNTMPAATLVAVSEGGALPADSVRPYYDDAHDVLHELADVGVDYGDVVAMLERQGSEKFTESWDELASSVRRVIDE